MPVPASISAVEDGLRTICIDGISDFNPWTEHPEIICFTDNLGRLYIFGTANETWQGDVYACDQQYIDGQLPADHLETYVLSSSPDDHVIAAAIVSATERHIRRTR